MFDKNDPVGKMGEVLGTLFGVMADEIIKQCGEEQGEKIIKDSMWRFGFYRGQKIREKVLAAGEELNFENFEKFYDIPENNGWDADSEIKGDTLTEYTRYCPYAKAWKELGLENIGSLYCAQDESMMTGYMGNIEFIRGKLFNDNEEGHCKMIVNKK